MENEDTTHQNNSRSSFYNLLDELTRIETEFKEMKSRMDVQIEEERREKAELNLKQIQTGIYIMNEVGMKDFSPLKFDFEPKERKEERSKVDISFPKRPTISDDIEMSAKVENNEIDQFTRYRNIETNREKNEEAIRTKEFSAFGLGFKAFHSQSNNNELERSLPGTIKMIPEQSDVLVSFNSNPVPSSFLESKKSAISKKVKVSKSQTSSTSMKSAITSSKMPLTSNEPLHKPTLSKEESALLSRYLLLSDDELKKLSQSFGIKSKNKDLTIKKLKQIHDWYYLDRVARDIVKGYDECIIEAMQEKNYKAKMINNDEGSKLSSK